MNVIVIGGGPAGMMAAIASAENGNNVILLEKKERLGRKLLITGKGRCNITSSLQLRNLYKIYLVMVSFCIVLLKIIPIMI